MAKYKSRRWAILLFYEAVYREGLAVLNNVISRMYWTLVANNFIPEMGVGIPNLGEIDADFRLVVCELIKAKIPIKRWLEDIAIPERRVNSILTIKKGTVVNQNAKSRTEKSASKWLRMRGMKAVVKGPLIKTGRI
jgi:hypothetical protein